MRTYITKAQREAWQTGLDPSEQTYLFFMECVPTDRFERRYEFPAGSHHKVQRADFVFVASNAVVSFHQKEVFNLVKNRTGGRFDLSPQYAWLKSQLPSIEFYHGLMSDMDDGKLAVMDDRDMLMIKMFYAA